MFTVKEIELKYEAGQAFAVASFKKRTKKRKKAASHAMAIQ